MQLRELYTQQYIEVLEDDSPPLNLQCISTDPALRVDV